MPRSLIIHFGALLLAGLLALAAPTRALAQTVIFRAATGSGNDTLYVGSRSTIQFSVDPNGATVYAVTCPFIFRFSNGNLFGSTAQFTVTPPSPVFPPDPQYEGIYGTDPDTVLFGIVDFGSGGFPDSLLSIAHLQFAPVDTGHIWIDTIALPPANHLKAHGFAAEELPIDWLPADIVVVPCPVKMGDLDGNGIIDARDIIWSVIAVFKCDFPPCWPVGDDRVGDVNCSGLFTSADIIYLVNHVFKGGPPPCACFLSL